jgi:Family of unknown function (DUF6474)
VAGWVFSSIAVTLPRVVTDTDNVDDCRTRVRALSCAYGWARKGVGMGIRRRSGSTMDSTKAAGRTAVKALKKAEKSAAKAASKTARKARRAGVAEVPSTGRTPLSSAQAKRLIGVGTTIVPLLAPYALAAATSARGRWDAYRADRLGVSTDQLAAFSGPGGALHARLSHLAERLAELGRSGTPAAATFSAEATPRLADLALAVRAAEQMPSARRRVAFRAVSGELDGIELTLLGHLGVSAQP